MFNGDSYGPLRPVNGSYLVRGAPETRSDLPVGPSAPVVGTWRKRLKQAAKAVALFVSASLALTSVMAIPILIGELTAIEALEIKGQSLPASQFVARLGNLLAGAAIVATSFVSLLAAAMFSSRSAGLRAPDLDPDLSAPVQRFDPVLAALIGGRHV